MAEDHKPPANDLSAIRRWITSVCPGSGTLDLVKDETGVATLTINNPRQKNALSASIMVQFDQVLTNLESWKDGKVLILQGAEGFFCSGIDLNLVRALVDDREGATLMSILMRDNLMRLHKLPMISVALIQGKALGGGAEVATACDFRLITTESEIGFVHVKMGITFAFGGGVLLTKIIGTSRALEVLASAKRYGASEAVRMGISSKAISADSDDNARTQALQWAEQFLNSQRQDIAEIKQYF